MNNILTGIKSYLIQREKELTKRIREEESCEMPINVTSESYMKLKHKVNAIMSFVTVGFFILCIVTMQLFNSWQIQTSKNIILAKQVDLVSMNVPLDEQIRILDSIKQQVVVEINTNRLLMAGLVSIMSVLFLVFIYIIDRYYNHD